MGRLKVIFDELREVSRRETMSVTNWLAFRYDELRRLLTGHVANILSCLPTPETKNLWEDSD